MTDTASALQPAIDVLEQDLADLERQANALLTSINVLRAKAGLPPRPGGWSNGAADKDGRPANSTPLKLHSDSFTGKKLASAVREYLAMRRASGHDAPATSREIFDALKQGGFASGAKDESTALVVLRTMLRKNTITFAKLQNGKYGLRSWYPNLKQPKVSSEGAEDAAAEAELEPDTETETAAPSDEDKAAAA